MIKTTVIELVAGAKHIEETFYLLLLNNEIVLFFMRYAATEFTLKRKKSFSCQPWKTNFKQPT